MARGASAREEGGTWVTGGIRLGRIHGVEIVLSYSLIIIFWLVAVSLGSGTLPSLHPDWPAGVIWGAALAAASLFFVSILVHEMAHALVAQRYGVSVPRIVLFLFGGVSQLGAEPPSPKAELWIAAAGPATSIGLGVLGTLAGTGLVGAAPPGVDETALELMRRAGPLASILLWLGPINVLLGAFNLIPGFPLDGGRVLRALLWWRTGNLRTATLWASRVGQGVAYGLMAVGVAMGLGVAVPFFGYGLLPGLWVVLIGWFLLNAARSSADDLRVRAALGAVQVGSLMRAGVEVVPPELLVEDLVRGHILTSDQQAFPVEHEGHLAGLVTLSDVRPVPAAEWSHVTVREVMTEADRLFVVGPKDQATDALRLLLLHDVEQLPVVEQGHVLGLLRRKDVLKWVGLRHGEVPADAG